MTPPPTAPTSGAPNAPDPGSALDPVSPPRGTSVTLTNPSDFSPLPLKSSGRTTEVPSPLTLRERPAAPPAPAAPAKPFRLKVVRGELLGREYPLLPGKNYLGRSTPEKPADIDLTAQERPEQVWASRQHAVIALEGDGPTLEDLSSLNGTFINRVRLYPGQRCALRAGDVVQVGTVQLRVEG